LLVLGSGAYLLSSGKLVSNAPYEKEITNLETLSSSNETSDIEQDLQNTDLNDIDKELGDIENEINTSE